MKNLNTNPFRLATATLLLLLIGASLTLWATRRGQAAAPTATDRARVLEHYGKLPLSFEPNQGQADKAVKFLSRGGGYTLYLTDNEAVMALRNADKQSGFLKLKLVGANAAPEVAGQNQLEGKSNYLIGNDRSQWQTDVPTYGAVKYSEVWPGVEMMWYGNQRTLEYDFIVQPGVNPQQIKLAFEGAQSLRMDGAGNLVWATRAGEITQHAPVIYQEGAGGREAIAGNYVLQGARAVGFEIGAYDASRPLVIDPQLVYSTYVGGAGLDQAFDIAVDSRGQAYVAGTTRSLNFPVTATVDPEADPTTATAFITKLNAAGTGVIYSTIIGKDHDDIPQTGIFGTEARGVAVTSDGKACLTGYTDNFSNKGEFPVTSNAFQKNGACLGVYCTFERQTDAFVTMLNAQGNGLIYSTFYGSSASYPSNAERALDVGEAIAVDSASRIYITGFSGANNLPMKNAFQNSPNSSGDGKDAFIAVFNPAATNGNDTLLYASYLGGERDDIGKGIAVDNVGNAYVVGSTASSDLATKAPAGQSLPPLQAVFQGGFADGFVAKIDTESEGDSSLVYLTFFGGDLNDRVESVAVDANQRAYITGASNSTRAFPLLNAFDTEQNNGEAFVAKLNADGTALFYSSFLGGTNNTAAQGGFEEGLGIAIDAGGNAYVTGRTSAGATFPVGAVAPPFPAALQGTAFIAKVEASVSATTIPKLLYSTTFGGQDTGARAVALDLKGNVYLAGFSTGNLPTTGGAFQPAFNGGNSDGFVAKIGGTFPDTIGVFRASEGSFLQRNSNTAGEADITTLHGVTGDLPIAGDWNGDGFDETGVFRPATGQFILRRGNGTCFIPPCTITLTFGQAGDLPLAGDWNGDGLDTIGVFRNGQFLLSNSPNINNTSPVVNVAVNFGLGTDVPLTGDWDGNGIDTPGVFRDGFFFLTNGINGENVNNSFPLVDFNAIFGQIGDLPVSGDWEGDGVDTIGVFVAGTWQLRNSNTTGPPDLTFNFGRGGDVPVAGDWNRLP
jgi:hypothetical protein